MSRQFDEHMADKFEIYGEFYSLIEPSNLGELMKAIQVKDVIQTAISGLMHDETSSGWDEFLQTQEHDTRMSPEVKDIITDYLKGELAI